MFSLSLHCLVVSKGSHHLSHRPALYAKPLRSYFHSMLSMEAKNCGYRRDNTASPWLFALRGWLSKHPNSNREGLQATQVDMLVVLAYGKVIWHINGLATRSRSVVGIDNSQGMRHNGFSTAAVGPQIVMSFSSSSRNPPHSSLIPS
jgi:hypothetical protein